MRATLLVSLGVVALPLAAQTPALRETHPSSSRVSCRQRFLHDARVNNSDVPAVRGFARARERGRRTMRRTRLAFS